jgi:hypothetical protein
VYRRRYNFELQWEFDSPCTTYHRRLFS